MTQNGPIHISSDYSLFENQYAWTNVADYVWVDQPVYVVAQLRDVSSNERVTVGPDSVLLTQMATVSTVDD